MHPDAFVVSLVGYFIAVETKKWITAVVFMVLAVVAIWPAL